MGHAQMLGIILLVASAGVISVAWIYHRVVTGRRGRYGKSPAGAIAALRQSYYQGDLHVATCAHRSVNPFQPIREMGQQGSRAVTSECAVRVAACRKLSGPDAAS